MFAAKSSRGAGIAASQVRDHGSPPRERIRRDGRGTVSIGRWRTKIGASFPTRSPGLPAPASAVSLPELPCQKEKKFGTFPCNSLRIATSEFAQAIESNMISVWTSICMYGSGYHWGVLMEDLRILA
jgi:hypothetical protein